MTDGDARARRNGDAAEDAIDDVEDPPLEEGEAEAGDAVARTAVDETLGERIDAVIDDLPDVERRQDGDATAYATRNRVFAVHGVSRLETALDPTVASAALRTPDTAPSPRGAGWIAFTPAAIDRFALDRAEAWIRSAHRGASTERA